MHQPPELETAAPSNEHDIHSTGELLSGRYQIEAFLGSGAMGKVYRAEHVLMKKTVAVKVLHPEMMQNAEVVKRFQLEAQAAGNIKHPNVCTATDFGLTETGDSFLVMEYLEGETLQTTLQSFGRLALPRAIHITQQICAALEQAHSEGIVHRDLKPENIMLVERDGDSDFVKLMDFGIASVRMEKGNEPAATTTRLTQAGMVYGTPHYMSPEQVVGAEIDHRVDLYSVGVMLFEMLTGKLPFDSDSLVRLMGMHITEAVPLPSSVCAEAKIPAALDALVLSLLAKAPDDRPKNAGSVRSQLLEIDEQIKSGKIPRVQVQAFSGSVKQGKLIVPLVQKIRELGFVARAVLIGTLAALVFLSALAVIASRVKPIPKEEKQEAIIKKETVSLSTERERLLKDEAVSSALAEAANHNMDALRKLIAEKPKNAHLHYLGGIAEANAGNWKEAFSNYSQAVTLDERYSNEPQILDDVFSRFEVRTAATAAPAKDFLVKHPSSRTTARLETMAQAGPNHTLRRRAFDTLHENGEFAKLEPWSQAAMELRAASGCEAHREKIAKIVEIGDRRAMPVIRAVEALPKTGCGFLKRQDCYACVRDDIKNAITKLEPSASQD